MKVATVKSLTPNQAEWIPVACEQLRGDLKPREARRIAEKAEALLNIPGLKRNVKDELTSLRNAAAGYNYTPAQDLFVPSTKPVVADLEDNADDLLKAAKKWPVWGKVAAGVAALGLASAGAIMLMKSKATKEAQ